MHSWKDEKGKGDNFHIFLNIFLKLFQISKQYENTFC